MEPNLQGIIDLIRQECKGVNSILVSDREGVEIISSPSDYLSENTTRQNAQIVSTIFSLTHEQCEKLDSFGSTKYLISEFGEHDMILQGNFPPMVITIRADKQKTGEAGLVSCLGRIQGLVASLREGVETVQNV
jgi:hypothetical protein